MDEATIARTLIQVEDCIFFTAFVFSLAAFTWEYLKPLGAVRWMGPIIVFACFSWFVEQSL
jgi:hypothetical protein